MISLGDYFPVQPIEGVEIPSEILNNHRFYPYFKDCIGATDGIPIRAKVQNEGVSQFRSWKDYPTKNVFAAYTFDIKFTYVLPGWEVSASYFWIIKNPLTRKDKLLIPQISC